MRERWPLRRGHRPSTSCLCGAMAVNQRSPRSHSVGFVYEDFACHGTCVRGTQDQLSRSITDKIHGTDYAVKKSTAPSRYGSLGKAASLRAASAQTPGISTPAACSSRLG